MIFLVEIIGLTGLRPTKEAITRITTPPYDVIRPGTDLEALLKRNEDSLFHITLGSDSVSAFQRLVSRGVLKEDNEPCFYVYEQNYNGKARLGVLVGARVSDYSKGEIIRHERVFDEKVQAYSPLVPKF